MPPEDCSVIDVNCQVGNAAASAFERIALSAGEAAGQLIGQSLTWWVQTDSVDPDNEVVRGLQQYTVPVALLVLTGSVLVQSIRMVLSRKKDPAINVGLGLIRYAVVTTIGLGLLALALKAGDDMSSWLVDTAVSDFSERMRVVLGGQAIENPFLLLLMAALGCVLAAIQWLLGFIRQAGILVLAVMLPLAASGSINDSTKVWLNRLLPWLIALVLYKPMAALIYTIGFGMLAEAGNSTPEGADLTVVMTGLMVMVLAVLAMPALLRFFSWSQVTATGGAGAGGLLAAGATGAASLAALQSSRSMSMTGPGSAGPAGAVGSAGPGGQPGPHGPGSSSGAASGGQGSSAGGAAMAAGAAGAAGAQEAGAPSARAGAGVPATVGTSGAGGGAAGAGGGAAGGAGAAAAGPAGAAAAGGAAVARGAYQAGQAAVDGFTQDGEQR